MPKSEEKWLRGARRFEERILGEIYDELSPELFRYAYRLLGDSEQAEDLLSETFLRFLRSLQVGGGPKDHLRAYLYRTMHNLVVDRHRRNEPAWSELIAEQISADELSNPAVSVQRQLEGHEVRALLWQLTIELRQVIVLKFFQGLRNAEIAKVLGKTTGSVKALQHRGLASLQKLIEKGVGKQE
jgi:RNA polymerase sigma-70 factor (ECF subfamily)